eukprot:1156507-Pelagomonas_calceolata.AAC.1
MQQQGQEQREHAIARPRCLASAACHLYISTLSRTDSSSRTDCTDPPRLAQSEVLTTPTTSIAQAAAERAAAAAAAAELSRARTAVAREKDLMEGLLASSRQQ